VWVLPEINNGRNDDPDGLQLVENGVGKVTDEHSSVWACINRSNLWVLPQKLKGGVQLPQKNLTSPSLKTFVSLKSGLDIAFRL
jgi:hypothetical protein